MKNEFWLQRDDLQKVLDFVDCVNSTDEKKTSYSGRVKIMVDNSSGIGYNIAVSVPITIEGYTGEFSTNIVGEENW